MAKYNVGVFGIGNVSTEYIKALNNNPLSEIIAVVGRDKTRTRATIAGMNLSCEVMENYDELVNRQDIDVMVITSPHFLHAAEAIKAAQAGKHVIVEKPIGMNLAEMQQVREAITQAGVKSQCGMVLRWNPFIENLKRLLEKRALGDIFYVEVDYFHELGPWWNGFTWDGHKKRGGPSASLVAGIHAVDLTRWLCGEVTEVFAHQTWGHRKDFEYPPTYMATLKFQNGAVGKTSCSFEIESPYVVNVILYGSSGSVINEKFYLKDLFPGQTGWQKFETIMPDSGAVSHHPFQQLVNDFIGAIDNDTDSCVNIEETYKTHELCVAIDRSMELGEKVALPLEL